jgi:hypothetical protein
MIFYPLFSLQENVANIVNQQNTKDLGLNWKNYRLLALPKMVHLGLLARHATFIIPISYVGILGQLGIFT